ncbi:cell wall metabolism sensor histidine kinase WalK [Blastococcus sp. TF02A-30]|uniref:sensor histidine kinase n=1 Tax=Blastococcus sp. TF02A-30 TaxID=2250580 RepID=UPI000DE9706D|nr:HAMP domain-containing sensor histidine kinase [Blastococcus sp. TF02A-30]RBY92994.1 sensor histidine kinase [Blastococcus sp. TF02A-30]
MTAPLPPAPRGGSRVPLRVTLVALLVGLVAVALLVTALATTSLLRSYLTDQQDESLRSTVSQASPRVLQACLDGEYRVTPQGAYAGCLPPEADAVVDFQGPADDDSLPRLDGADVAAGDFAHHPRTVRAEDGTRWRVMSGELPGGYALVVGLDLEADQRAIKRLAAIEAVVGFVVLSVLAVAGNLLVRNSLRPLAEVERTAQAIAAGDLSQRVPAGDQRTEVGRLSSALNGMLSRIESAFRAQQASEAEARGSEEKMRRFVADASHELRTPLTSIRGFAELYRQGAVGTDEDVTRLMQRIESEGARMGELVEDLLLLARLDQRRPLAVAPVDLAELAGDAVHDARAVQPERPISLHLEEDLADVPVVLGDEARLRQVLGNLVTNALTHTPPDARITVTVGADPDPDVVQVRVADEGPGMGPEDARRAFERFYRADSSRTRADGASTAGGTGLGLAIVASLVAAHGGSVDLTTAPGEGATFTVRLRREGPPAGGAAPPA